jgi:hypothetical protein
VRGDFEFEFGGILGALRVHMMAKVEATLIPFLAFIFYYNVSKVHTMLALMLNSHFKSFNVVKVFVECAKVIQIVAKYDNKILQPLLVVAFDFLNLATNGLIETTLVNDDSIFWGSGFNRNHFAQVVEKCFEFFSPFACEAKRFCIAFDLVEVP